MPSRTQSVLIAGVTVGVIALAISLFMSGAMSPAAGMLVGCVTCLLYMAPGLMATWHYSNTHHLTIPGGTGAGMGSLAAIVSALISSLSSFALLISGRAAEQQEEMLRRMEEAGQDTEMARQVAELMTSPLGAIGAVVMSLALAALLGAIGGAIGASVFKRGGDATERSSDAF